MRDIEKKKSDFEEDPRFKTCFKEAIISYIFYFAFVVAVVSSTHLLGDDLVFGLPKWFFVGSIAVPIIFVLILIFLMEKVFEDMPLTDNQNAPSIIEEVKK